MQGESLCLSRLNTRRVENIDDFVKIGDTMKVKVIEVDSQGKVNVSKKEAAE